MSGLEPTGYRAFVRDAGDPKLRRLTVVPKSQRL